MAKFVFFLMSSRPLDTGLIIKLSNVLAMKSVSGGKVMDVWVETEIFDLGFLSLSSMPLSWRLLVYTLLTGFVKLASK